MPAPSLATDVFVLLKRPPADAFQAFTVFSAEHGTLSVLQRVSRKAATTSPPLDLFDQAALVLESSNQGRTWFVKEARILVRPADQGGAVDLEQVGEVPRPDQGLVWQHPVQGFQFFAWLHRLAGDVRWGNHGLAPAIADSEARRWLSWHAA